MTVFTAAEIVQFKAHLPRWGGFFRLEGASEISRIWLGVGNIRPGVSAIDPVDGGTYRGFGELADIGSFSSLCDGTSEQASFGFSNVPPQVFAQFSSSISAQQIAIKDRPISVGYGVMGPDWSMLGPVHWQWYGFADVISTHIAIVESAEEPSLWSIQLTAYDWLSGRRRSRRNYWADQQHQATHPGDKFFERTVMNAQGVQKAWPPAG